MKRFKKFIGALLIVAMLATSGIINPQAARAATKYSESYTYSNPIATGVASYTYEDGKVTFSNEMITNKLMTQVNIAGESDGTVKAQGFSKGGVLWIIYRNEGLYWYNYEILGKVGVLQKWKGLSESENIKATNLKFLGSDSQTATHYANQYGVDIPLPSWEELYKLVNGEDYSDPTPTQAPTPEPKNQTPEPIVPTADPTQEPIPVPTFDPIPAPTFKPVPVPTFEPDPVVVPTQNPDPVVVPTQNPDPVVVPTQNPDPVVVPTQNPDPVVVPTQNPDPVVVPTQNPDPVVVPTQNPDPVVVPTQEPVSFPTFEPITLRTFEPVVVPSAQPDIQIVDETKTIGEIDIWWDRFIAGQITWEEYLQVKGLFNWAYDEKTQELEHTYNIYDENGRLVEVITYRTGEKAGVGDGSVGIGGQSGGTADVDIEDKGKAKAGFEIGTQNNTTVYINPTGSAVSGETGEKSSTNDDYYHMRVKKNAKGNVTKLYEDGDCSKRWISQCKVTKKGYLKMNSKVFKRYGKVLAVTYSASGKKVIVLMTNGLAYKIPRKTKNFAKVKRIKGKGYIDLITDQWGLALNLQRSDGAIKNVSKL